MLLDSIKTVQVKLSTVKASGSNRDDLGDLKELQESMEQAGLLQPILLRQDLTIVAGERRYRAALQLKWQTITARILPKDYTAEQFEQLRLIENMQRKDLTPWEEARQLQQLTEKRPDDSLQDLGDLLGKSERWVAQRLSFLNLTPKLQALCVSHDWPLKLLPIMSRLPETAQLQLFEHLDEHGYTHKNEEPPSYTRLEGYIAHLQHALSAAPWKLDDAGLHKKAGACTACPKRSLAQSVLFAEVTDSKKDQCLDPVCWKQKQISFVEVRLDKLKHAGKAPILLKTYEPMDMELHKRLGSPPLQDAYQFNTVPKSTAGAQLGVYLNGRDIGKEVYVKSWRRDSSSTPKRAVDPDTGKPKPKSVKEKLGTLTQKRQCFAVELWAARLEEITVSFEDLIPVIAVFGTSHRHTARNDSHRNWTSLLKMKNKEELSKRLWQDVYELLQERCKRTMPIEQQAEQLWHEAVAQAAQLHHMSTLHACWKQACKEIPMSKTLEKAGQLDPHADGKMPKPSEKKGK